MKDIKRNKIIKPHKAWQVPVSAFSLSNPIIPAPIPYNPFLTFSTVTEKVPFVAKSTKISYSLFSSFGLIISIPLWAFNFQPFSSELFSDESRARIQPDE
jgi:hypothetical protein